MINTDKYLKAIAEVDTMPFVKKSPQDGEEGKEDLPCDYSLTESEVNNNVIKR